MPAALAVVIQVIWFQCWFFFKLDISMVLSAALAVVIQAIWLQPRFFFKFDLFLVVSMVLPAALAVVILVICVSQAVIFYWQWCLPL